MVSKYKKINYIQPQKNIKDHFLEFYSEKIKNINSNDTESQFSENKKRW